MTVFATILFLLQTAAAPAAQTGTITGQLRSVSGAPAAEVRVAAVPVSAENPPAGDSPTLVSIAQTDSEGRYRLENIPPGNYHVMAGLLDRPTYYPAATQPAGASVVRVVAGVPTQGVDFTLVRSAGVTVSGRVVRADGNTTIQQRLYLSGGSGINTPSNVFAGLDGSFSFPRVPPGNYSISLSPGFPGGRPVPITVGEGDLGGIEFFVPLVRKVSGRIVVNAGNPLPRFSLSFTSSEATIDSSGGSGDSFELILPEGDYRIGVRGFPFGYTVQSVTRGNTDLSRAPLSVRTTDVAGILISFQAPPPEAWLKVRGRVERPTGPGPAPTKVALDGSLLQRTEASIKGDGSFEFPKVLPGTYNLQIQPASGIQPLTVNVSRDIDDLKFVLPRQIEVRGRITVEDGGPVPYLSVLANGKQGVIPATMETVGAFRLILPEGEHRIVLPSVPQGYVLKSMTHGATNLLTNPLQISGTDTGEVVVTLGPATAWRRVSGKVSSGGDSTALNTLRVVLNGSNININVEAAVRDDGAFEFSKVPPGSYTAFLLPGTGVPPVPIVVADKDVGGVELRIPSRISVTGRVTMDDGVPLPRASIIVDNDAVIDLGMLGPDGSFTIRLPEGEHRFSARASSIAYRVKSMTLGPTNLLERPASIRATDPQQLLIAFQAAGPNSWRKISGGLRQSPDAGLTSNRVLMGGTVIQNVEAPLAADGSFEFPKVPPGTYAVYLQPPGLYSASAEFEINDNDVTAIELAPPEIITIKVLVSIENGGAPASKATVMRAQTARPIRGTMGMVESVMDSDGIELALIAGEFGVRPVRLPAGFTVRSMTYGATDLLKSPLRVDGPTNTQIEVTLRSVDPASITGPRISGSVRMPSGEGTPRPTLVSFSATGSLGQTYQTPIRADNSFEFSAIPPGTYEARLIGPDIPAAIEQYRKQVLVTGSDQTGVELTAVTWAHVRGRVALDGSGPFPNFKDNNTAVEFRQGGFSIGDAIRPDGAFEMALVRGDYQVALRDLPERYYIKSITSNGTDLLQGRFTHDANGPREIVITLGIRTVAR